jgi:hypothetical protein
MRRTHLRGHSHIVKRLVVHMGRFKLGLFLRTLFGIGTPRGCRGRAHRSSFPEHTAVITAPFLGGLAT